MVISGRSTRLLRRFTPRNDGSITLNDSDSALDSPLPSAYTLPMLKNADIQTVFNRFEAANPDPRSELNYSNPYTLLVAVTLSAQATDKGVNKATDHLFEVVQTPKAMLELGEAGLKEYIKTIGLYNNKAKNLIAQAEQLVEQHHGDVPHERTALEALPGVGKKTAAVVMNVAFDAPTLAVDTHVFRVANRLGIVKTKTPDQTEAPLTKKLKRLLPPGQMRHAHHWLILHGRYVCKARKPECFRCTLVDLCQFKGKTV